jgi:transcriptional regulator with XRE-family HTH domain
MSAKKAKTPAATVGSRIAQARATYSMSQAQLGMMLDVTRAAVSQYEKNKIAPRAQVIDRLAEVFNAAPEWFTHGRGTEPRPADVPIIIPEIDVGLITPQIGDLHSLKTGRLWSLPSAAFDHPVAADHMVAFVSPFRAQPVSIGDRVVIDMLLRSAAEAGVFLVYQEPRGARLCRCDKIPAEAHVLGRVVALLRTV